MRSVHQQFYGFPDSEDLCLEYATVLIEFERFLNILAFVEYTSARFTFHLRTIGIGGYTAER